MAKLAFFVSLQAMNRFSVSAATGLFRFGVGHGVLQAFYYYRRRKWARNFQAGRSASLAVPRALLRLRIITEARASKQTGFIDTNLELVVFGGLVLERGSKREFVVGLGVLGTFFQSGVDVIADVESETAALDGEDLQGDIAPIRLIRTFDAFDVTLPIERAARKIGSTQRIDAIERDAALAQERGELNHVRKDLAALFVVHLLLDARAGEQRPAGRNPENEFATRTGSFTVGQSQQRIERNLEALHSAIDAGGTTDGVQANGVLMQGSAQHVAIFRETILELNAGIGEEGQGRREGEMAAIGEQEFIDFGGFVGDALNTGVDIINHDDAFNGGLGGGDGLKRVDGYGDFVVQYGEILYLETADGRAILRSDNHIEINKIGRRLR